MNRPRITPEQDTIIREMAPRKASITEIAAATKASRGMLRRYMAKHGIVGRKADYSPIPQAVRDEVSALLLAGLPRAEIQRRYKMANATIDRIKQNAGMELRRALYTPEEDATIRRLAAEGAKAAVVLEALPGRTYSSLHARTVVLGISLNGRKQHTDEIVAQVREMAAAGASRGDIGAVIGWSRTSLRRLMRSSGIATGPRPVKVKAKRASRAKPKPVVLRAVRRVAGPPEMVKILAVFPVADDAQVEARNRAVNRRGCDMPMWGGTERPTHMYCGAATAPGQSYCAACYPRTVTTSAGIGFSMKNWGRAA